MAVYVDKAQHQLGRMIMCHMLADTIHELHTMADRLGLPRAWYQATSNPHYDLSKGKRKDAVALGCIELDRRQVGQLIQDRRPTWVAEAMVQHRQYLQDLNAQLAARRAS